MKYQSVNGAWPQGTNDGRDLKPTPQEAMSAARRLYRYVMKKPFRGKIVVTSGRRYTWIRNHVMYVNPDQKRWSSASGGGWHELVHDLSHLFAQRLFPSAKGHGHQHESIERDMVHYVVESGWLDGKLKRPDKPPVDRQAKKLDSIAARIVAWERKERRAITALKKLRAQKKRLDARVAS